ncbi:hypothetical protein D7X33_49635, partial [Butyricicoccus sp. 1XD8-22]
MKNQLQSKKTKKFTRKSFIILIVCITTGFIIGYSYNLTKDEKKVTNHYFEQEETYRSELIEQQERNNELTKELNNLHLKIREYEQNFASDEKKYEQLVNEAEKLRLLIGKIPAQGQGIKITLRDG